MLLERGQPSIKRAMLARTPPDLRTLQQALPPSSVEARICTYECTFCPTCVDRVLDNVCPNCGGRFVPRPIRPSRNWTGDNFLGTNPASTKIKHRPVSRSSCEVRGFYPKYSTGEAVETIFTDTRSNDPNNKQ